MRRYESRRIEEWGSGFVVWIENECGILLDFWREARRGFEEMRNACPMPSLSCGRGIALHRCLTTRSVSCPPRPTATSSSSSSSLTSLQHARNGVRLAIATRRVEFSFARAFGGGGDGGRGVGVVFVGQETPTQWKRRSWSSVRPMSSLGKKPEKDGDAKSEVLESVVAAAAGGEMNMIGKPETCTADELHYVAVPGTAWRLALWRYLPNLRVILLIQPILVPISFNVKCECEYECTCVRKTRTHEEAHISSSLWRIVSELNFATFYAAHGDGIYSVQ